mmetsp:Transcript_23434/g.72991  ORF Transcript_23434/g.72991 Transcript_23434/m.72991 type:complete len:330 (-) Transcript_23434:972-1961(-)
MCGAWACSSMSSRRSSPRSSRRGTTCTCSSRRSPRGSSRPCPPTSRRSWAPSWRPCSARTPRSGRTCPLCCRRRARPPCPPPSPGLLARVRRLIQPTSSWRLPWTSSRSSTTSSASCAGRAGRPWSPWIGRTSRSAGMAGASSFSSAGWYTGSQKTCAQRPRATWRASSRPRRLRRTGTKSPWPLPLLSSTYSPVCPRERTSRSLRAARPCRLPSRSSRRSASSRDQGCTCARPSTPLWTRASCSAASPGAPPRSMRAGTRRWWTWFQTRKARRTQARGRCRMTGRRTSGGRAPPSRPRGLRARAVRRPRERRGLPSTRTSPRTCGRRR